MMRERSRGRTYLLEALGTALSRASVEPVAVVLVDIDRFQMINQAFGHTIGDRVLADLLDRLNACIRPDDHAGRFGGDEFAVVLLGDGANAAHDVAERIRRACSAPVRLDDIELDLTCSAGVAVATGDVPVSVDDLLRDAESALSRAKERGRDQVIVATPEHRRVELRAVFGRHELMMAIRRGEMVPYFQPILDLETGRTVGFEAVARWLHPERGLLTPDAFVPMAEERGLIGELGASILEASLEQLAHWRTIVADEPWTMSVNVSARQLIDPRFVDVVASALERTGVPAETLWLELTESVLVTDVASAEVSLRALRDLGLHLAVDDFGTGYSSLVYLTRFPVEAIKVDRGFVAGLGRTNEDSTIVDAVVRLGASLGLMVVAEGVETPQQLNRLRAMGCPRAQGYLFGRPRPAELLDPAAVLV
jgi:diguanylate cyclase (GGDEF)-like protein